MNDKVIGAVGGAKVTRPKFASLIVAVALGSNEKVTAWTVYESATEAAAFFGTPLNPGAEIFRVLHWDGYGFKVAPCTSSEFQSYIDAEKLVWVIVRNPSKNTVEFFDAVRDGWTGHIRQASTWTTQELAREFLARGYLGAGAYVDGRKQGDVRGRL